jgi:hypothetical protein
MLALIRNQLHQGSNASHETGCQAMNPQFRVPMGQICSGSQGHSPAGVLTTSGYTR